MRLVCPSCAAAYDVPDDKLSAGRVVRCARCDEEWTPVGARPAPLPAPAAPPEPPTEPPAQATVAQPTPAPPGPVSANAVQRAPWRGGRMLLPAAWAASFVLLAGLAWGSYAWRAEVMASWPPSERLYAALGLDRPR